jgi:hypothetical protein
MKLRRAFHSQDKKIDKLTSQLSNVAQTWKGEVTSQRNTCYLPGMGALETNGQEWLAQTPLQVGFGGVGATGAHHSRKTAFVLEAMTLNSVGYELAEHRAFELRLESARQAPWLWIQVHFDATPMQFEFGSLREV